MNILKWFKADRDAPEFDESRRLFLRKAALVVPVMGVAPTFFLPVAPKVVAPKLDCLTMGAIRVYQKRFAEAMQATDELQHRFILHPYHKQEAIRIMESHRNQWVIHRIKRIEEADRRNTWRETA